MTPYPLNICDIVVFTQDISKDTRRIAPSYLIGWKEQVETLDNVPHLWWHLCIKLPGKNLDYWCSSWIYYIQLNHLWNETKWNEMTDKEIKQNEMRWNEMKRNIQDNLQQTFSNVKDQ